ncbi:phosphoribosylglycinamide formyltransferase [Tardiphaga sp. vice352]|uniref:phosphoribosylglycinamide formyltransferase n=1 Tax=unclassified Tardiphaga TaxID=2631404 RepID=UPI001162FA89|nr:MULTISPECIES: phosphoribosylglycinamide formyltransferase [unclassified Tardiphaga]MBC7582614.1 phosphoribosylglycinamide formyltransferase [Tardiphaga sp.]QDM22021.1 phosphoribosylglycinamide formyltransferase [Tardiphaga sp. vice154]QDM27275.1 phosphoribosylglycinamide formyltransferase [Tardiphaga sp. vice304]QDM32400.1 phosphoribosylglycinamide formyltransferase [Tardiphaga sp. vice352]
MRRVAILISGRGSNMTALIEAARANGFPAEIALVISNRVDAPGLAAAAQAGVETLVIESKPFGRDRAGFETVLQKALDDHRIELICLGGFMRLFTADFVQRWYGRMLNIHPSLLPSFPGLDPHGQALRAGVRISGATVHFVIPETDAGPIVMQGAVSVADDDTADTLAARVLGIEHKIYPQALRLLATDAIRIDGDICRVRAGASTGDDLISPTLT